VAGEGGGHLGVDEEGSSRRVVAKKEGAEVGADGVAPEEARWKILKIGQQQQQQ